MGPVSPSSSLLFPSLYISVEGQHFAIAPHVEEVLITSKESPADSISEQGPPRRDRYLPLNVGFHRLVLAGEEINVIVPPADTRALQGGNELYFQSKFERLRKN